MHQAKASPNKLLFILSVDTEEEFDWSGEFPQRDCSVKNIDHLPEFHSFCTSLGVRPTYLVDYPVASNPDTASILRSILNSGSAEIGAHLHPWCTPPIEGLNSERESHVINLPEALIRRKLEQLLAAMQKNMGVNPVVFRTGRWGIDSKVLKILIEYGFKVDSSVYPYYENEFFSCLDACDKPYWPDMSEPNYPGQQRDIYELPVTSGFNRSNFSKWGKMHAIMSSPMLSGLRLVGLAWHTQLLRKLYMSPELSSSYDMVALAKAALASGSPVIHMFLHSSTLLETRGQYNQHNIGRDALCARIRAVVDFLKSEIEIEFCTLSEAASKLAHPEKPDSKPI